jgi:Acetyltransferase (GNAT) domain
MNRLILHGYPTREVETEWNEFLTKIEFPCHYIGPAYFSVPFWEGKKPFAILVFDENKIVGAATGLFQNGKLTCGLKVRPQMAMIETEKTDEIAKELHAGLIEIARNKASLITLNSWQNISCFRALGYAGQPSEGTDRIVVIDLSIGADAVFKGFSQSRRSALRKIIRENNLEISELETAAELEEFYAIHTAWCKNKKIEPHPLKAMQTISTQKESGRILIAKHQGKVVAGSYFRFQKNGVIEYSENNSNPAYLHFSPNELLVWKSIEMACKQGFTHYSMGASHPFLQRFGGETRSTYRYQIDLSFFKKHEKIEVVKSFVLKTYQSFSVENRRKLKSVIGRFSS